MELADMHILKKNKTYYCEDNFIARVFLGKKKKHNIFRDNLCCLHSGNNVANTQLNSVDKCNQLIHAKIGKNFKLCCDSFIWKKILIQSLDSDNQVLKVLIRM